MKILQINAVNATLGTDRTCKEMAAYLNLHNHESLSLFSKGIGVIVKVIENLEKSMIILFLLINHLRIYIK